MTDTIHTNTCQFLQRSRRRFGHILLRSRTTLTSQTPKQGQHFGKCSTGPSSMLEICVKCYDLARERCSIIDYLVTYQQYRAQPPLCSNQINLQPQEHWCQTLYTFTLYSSAYAMMYTNTNLLLYSHSFRLGDRKFHLVNTWSFYCVTHTQWTTEVITMQSTHNRSWF